MPLKLKLRVFEKLFMCIINTALERYGDSKYDSMKRSKFEEEVTDCMRKKNFGNEESGRLSQWKFKWKEGNCSIEKQSFTGSTCTKFMMGMAVLAATIYKPELDQGPNKNNNHQLVREKNEKNMQLWLSISKNLIPLWTLIEQHHDFSEDDILSLHKKSNIFMTQWVELYGTKHMTNYIHIIGSSHLTYFAQKYGNLYWYSQQGWKTLNQMLKHFYFNNTNHRGAYGNGGKSADGTYSQIIVCGDHCRPLMRLCQRTLM
jgi:hypothetical protein